MTIDWSREGGPYHKTCPDCHRHVKKDGDPTLSPGGFLDQIVCCDCGWCGVNSVMLTELEAKKFLANVRSKQLRLL